MAVKPVMVFYAQSVPAVKPCKAPDCHPERSEGSVNKIIKKQYMQDIRNIAIIAHVDHGKTTIVDRMIYQARQAREQEKLGELILDNNDL